MAHAIQYGCAALLSLGLIACHEPQANAAAHAMPSAATPPTPAPTMITDAQALAFIASQYGSSASLRSAWTNARQDSLQVCADGDAVVAGTAQRLLAVCTTLKQAEFNANGRIDLFAIALKDGKVAAVAQSRALTFWFSGGPAQVKVVRIGRERHAFDIQARVLDEYGELRQRTWYVARDGGFAKALTLPAHYASDGTAWCRYAETTTCEGAITDIGYDLRIDARNTEADAYPISVETQGSRCDEPFAATTTALQFDTGALTYRVPATLRAPTTDCVLDAKRHSSEQD